MSREKLPLLLSDVRPVSDSAASRATASSAAVLVGRPKDSRDSISESADSRFLPRLPVRRTFSGRLGFGAVASGISSAPEKSLKGIIQALRKSSVRSFFGMACPAKPRESWASGSHRMLRNKCATRCDSGGSIGDLRGPVPHSCVCGGHQGAGDRRPLGSGGQGRSSQGPVTRIRSHHYRRQSS